jgi:hypothetical protein
MAENVHFPSAMLVVVERAIDLKRVPSLGRLFMADRQKTDRQKPERHFTELNFRPKRQMTDQSFF